MISPYIVMFGDGENDDGDADDGLDGSQCCW